MKVGIPIWKERHDGIQTMLCINQAGVKLRRYREHVLNYYIFIYFTMCDM